MFSLYAALIKNLRGVVIFDPSDDIAWERVNWLSKRFKYRNLGVPPSLYKSSADKLARYMGGRPFRLLAYPVSAFEPLPAKLSQCLGIERELAESLVMASLYISPLMVLSERYSKELEAMATDKVAVCKDLSLADWKLHMRIADYSILDMYEFSVNSSLRVLDARCDESVAKEALAERVEKISRDKKRYWRVACSGGKSLLLYVDNLSLFVNKCAGECREAQRDLAAALAVVPAIKVGI